MAPILEIVAEIIEKGKYKKGKKTEAQLNKLINQLFKMHRTDNSEESAKRIYQEIITLAELGKGNLAKKFAMQFEREVNY